MRILRAQKDTPATQDIGPVDITGGQSSEDFPRGLRNAK